MTLLDGAINMEEKMLSRAIKVSGWSHMCCNLMKHAGFCVDRWPAILECVRTLCRVLRNLSWRKTIIAALNVQHPAVEKTLASLK